MYVACSFLFTKDCWTAENIYLEYETEFLFQNKFLSGIKEDVH